MFDLLILYSGYQCKLKILRQLKSFKAEGSLAPALRESAKIWATEIPGTGITPGHEGNIIAEDANDNDSNHNIDFSELYPWASPKAFIASINIIVVLHCYQMALLLFSYGIRFVRFFSADTHAYEGIILVILTITPIIFFWSGMDARIIASWSLLEVLSKANQAAFEEVIELGIEERQQYNKMRAFFMMHFGFESSRSMKKKDMQLYQVFCKYDTDGDEKLDMDEFSRFCKEMCGGRLSKSRIQSFACVIDRDRRRRAELHETNTGRLVDASLHGIRYQGKRAGCCEVFFGGEDAIFISYESFRRFIVGLENFRAGEHELYAIGKSIQSAQSIERLKSSCSPKVGNLAEKYSPRPDEDTDAEYLPYRKKALVYAFKTNDAVTFDKSWGISRTRNPGDYIVVMMGESSDGTHDSYAVGIKEFESSYVPVKGRANLYRKGGVVFAQKMTENFEVVVRDIIDVDGIEKGEPTIVKGVEGDYIVRPVGGSVYVIKAENFDTLYEKTIADPIFDSVCRRKSKNTSSIPPKMQLHSGRVHPEPNANEIV